MRRFFIVALAMLGLLRLQEQPAFGQYDTIAVPNGATMVDGQLKASTETVSIVVPSTRTIATGIGSSFSVVNMSTDGPNVTLASTEQIQVLGMQAFRDNVNLTVLAAGAAQTVSLTFSGLRADTTYYYRSDSEQTSGTTDAGGAVTFSQDVSSPRTITLTREKSTIFLDGNGNITPATTAITWDPTTRTYTLNRDINDSIIVVGGQVTLDGQDHVVDGKGKGIFQGIGVFGSGGVGCVLPPPPIPIVYFGGCNITIKRIKVTNFVWGLQVSGVAFSRFENIISTGNGVGIIAFQTYQNTITLSTFALNGSQQVSMGFNIRDTYVGNVLGAPGQLANAGFLVNATGDPGFFAYDNVLHGNTILAAVQGFVVQEALRLSISSNVVDSRSIPSQFPAMNPIIQALTLRRLINSPSPQVTVSGNTLYPVQAVGPNVAPFSAGFGVLSIDGLGNTYESNVIPFSGNGFVTLATKALPAGQDRFMSNQLGGFPQVGIHAIDTPGHIISGNTISAFGGAVLGGAQVSSNTASSLTGAAIQAEVGAAVTGNDARCQFGTALIVSGGVIRDNEIRDSNVGIQVGSAGGGAQIHNNNFRRNGTHTAAGAAANTWNLPYPGGGNHYDNLTSPDDFFGTGQNQEGSDRVVDAPRVINANNRDLFPFSLADRWKVADRTPPGKVRQLELIRITSSSATLRWIHSGDDGYVSTSTLVFPASYDIRVASFAVATNAAFEALPTLPTMEAPQVPPFFIPGDSTQTVVGITLTPNATFFFAIRLHDNDGNISFVSTTTPVIVVTSTDGVVTLGSPVPVNIALADPASASSVVQLATNEGLIQASAVYELTPSPISFNPKLRMTFVFDPDAVDTTTLAIYQSTSATATPSSATVTNQFIDLANNTISGDVVSASFFTLFFEPPDLLAPRTTLDIGEPSFAAEQTFISSATPLSFTAVDDARIVGDAAGVGVAETRFSIDGGTFAAFTAPFFIVAEGTHTVRFFSIDLRGSQEAVNTALLAVDSTPPATLLTVNGSTVPAGPVGAVEGSFFGFVASDPVSNGVASGIESTEFSVNAGPFAVFTSTFSLAIGSHTVAFRSKDNVRNLEALQTVLVTVVPPRAVFLDLDPDTLNLKSEGRWVAAYLETSGAQTAADVATDTVRISKINGLAVAPIFIDPEGPVSVGDRDANGIVDLAVKFDRARLIAVLPVEAQVKVTVEGRFKDGQAFETDDFIRTIRPGTVPAHLGGFVNHPTNARVHLPPGALSSDTDVSVLRISAAPESEEQPRDQAALAGRIARVGAPYEFGPEGSRFNAPVTLTLPYEASSLGGAREGGLRVAYWNPATRNWELLNSTVDPAARTVSAQTTHFSLYQVVSIGAQAVADFQLLQAYAFPNPVRGQNTVTIRVQPGLADSVAVRVYDVAGRKVHESSSFADRGAFDDGNGLGAQFTYDHVWDVSGVGSGVYTYAVTARKAGQADIRKTGKIGVVK